MQAITPITPIRLNDADRAALREVVKTLQMNQSSFIRAVIRESIAIIREENAQKAARPHGKRGAKKAMPHEWRKAN